MLNSRCEKFPMLTFGAILIPAAERMGSDEGLTGSNHQLCKLFTVVI